MKISKNGINLIHSFEGLSLLAYKVLESEKYFTIGWGHYGSDVYKGMRITREEADSLFLKDIVRFEEAVNNCKLGFTPNQNQFDALVSFCYNLGSGIMKDFIGMTSNQVAKDMLLYVNSGGQRLQGLVNRRNKEVELFNTPVANNNSSEYEEHGCFYPNELIYFRNKPYVGLDNPIQGTYEKGEYVFYDKVFKGNGYVWISWISRTGIRRYLPVRDYNNEKYGTLWGRIE